MAALKEIKRVKNAIMFQDEASGVKTILLQNVRLSFPFVGKPGVDENETGEKKESWRLMAMLPKATHEEAKNLVKELILELMTKNEVKVPKENWCLTDGDSDKYSEKKYEDMHGHFLVSAKDGQRRPTVRNQKAEVVDDIAKIDNMIYGGCWAHVMIRPWYFNGTTKNSKKTYPKRMLAGLNSLQFVKDDKPFGQGRIDDSDVYSSVDGAGNGMDDDDDGI